MHWTEAVAIVLLVIWAIPVLVATGYVALIFWGVLCSSLGKPKPRTRIETPLGEFVKEDLFWEGAARFDGGELHILASDVDHRPNPALLARIPRILEDLPALEELARRQVARLTDRHQLDQIMDVPTVDSAEFVLGFSWFEEVWGETVFVNFKGNTVVHWSSAD